MTVPPDVQRQVDQELLRLAENAETVMGGNDTLRLHHCRNGTWLFVGAAITAAAIGLARLNPWLVGTLMFVAGIALNELEERRLRAKAATG